MSTAVFGANSKISGSSFQPRKVNLPAWAPAKALSRPASEKLGAPEEYSKVMTAVTLGLPTAIAAATSYVGFRQGSIDTGIPQALGYMVGLAGAVFAVWGILGMAGLVKIPFNLNR
jgi:hypothetical protein